jgi:hypothetical protein
MVTYFDIAVRDAVLAIGAIILKDHIIYKNAFNNKKLAVAFYFRYSFLHYVQRRRYIIHVQSVLLLKEK